MKLNIFTIRLIGIIIISKPPHFNIKFNVSHLETTECNIVVFDIQIYDVIAAKGIASKNLMIHNS